MTSSQLDPYIIMNQNGRSAIIGTPPLSSRSQASSPGKPAVRDISARLVNQLQTIAKRGQDLCRELQSTPPARANLSAFEARLGEIVLGIKEMDAGVAQVQDPVTVELHQALWKELGSLEQAQLWISNGTQ